MRRLDELALTALKGGPASLVVFPHLHACCLSCFQSPLGDPGAQESHNSLMGIDGVEVLQATKEALEVEGTPVPARIFLRQADKIEEDAEITAVKKLPRV